MADTTPAPPSLGSFLRPHAAALTVGVLFIVGASACYMAMPAIMRHAVDALGTFDGTPADRARVAAVLGTAALLLLPLALLRSLLTYYMRWLIIGASRSIERDLRNTLFARLQTLSAGWYDRMRSGDILSRAINDIEGIRMMIGIGFLQGANTLAMAVFGIGGMVWISPRLTALALLPLLVAALAMRRLGGVIHRLSTDVQEQLSELSNRAQENFSGARVVKSFAQEAREEEAFERLNAEALARNLRLAKAQGAINAALAILGEAGVAATLWFGGRDIIAHELTRGQFLAFVAYQSLLVWPMIALGWILNLTQRGLACWERVTEVLKEESEVQGPMSPAAPATPDPGPRTLDPASAAPPRIEFDRLTFAYRDGPPALRDVSFEVPAGRVVAVVGRTGSGKSTLAHLLARFYPVGRGLIRVDGRDLNDIPPRALRERLGYVPQETFLFSEPIRENIRFGRPEAADEAVQLAARMAHLLPDIQDFPGRLGQVVGERGVTLSGGQKQRTALARVIAKSPSLVILDDAFASVDTHTEAEILAELRSFLRGRTAIVIAHRIATVRDADWIVVLDEGRVVEQGTHATLLRGGALYAAMAGQQAMEEALDEA